jgi:hypothetical protein
MCTYLRVSAIILLSLFKNHGVIADLVKYFYNTQSSSLE